MRSLLLSLHLAIRGYAVTGNAKRLKIGFRTGSKRKGMSLVGGSTRHQFAPIFKVCRTILECPLWESSDTKSPCHAQDYPAISFVGSSGHQVTPIFRDAQDYILGCPLIVTPSHPSIQRCPRTILRCRSWGPPDAKSHHNV